MGKTERVAAVDLGSGTVRIALLENRNGEYVVIAAAGVATDGMRKGAVSGVDEVAGAIRLARSHIKKTTGIEVKSAFVGIGDYRIQTMRGTGLVAISRADGEISHEDVRRAILSAEESLPRLQNRRILETLPASYRVDGDEPVEDPVGMHGMKLEAEVVFVTTFVPHLKTAEDAIDAAGIRPDDIGVSAIAASELLLTRRQKEIGVLLCDFGAETTTVSVWEEDHLLSMEIFPIGSAHITRDIALGFQIDLETAEKLKRTYTSYLDGGKKDLRISHNDKNMDVHFSPKKLEEIIHARLSDIFELTNKHLKKIDRHGLLPAGVVLTGGGTRLAGIAEIAKRELMLPSQLGTLTGFSGKKELVDGPEWATVLGLCHWGLLQDQNNLSRVASGAWIRKFRQFARLFVP